MTTLRVTVIMPTYNRRKLLERAIGSVLAQSFTDLELIVVNDRIHGRHEGFLDGVAKKVPRAAVYHEKNYYPDIPGL